jgi:hypothetical protein
VSGVGKDEAWDFKPVAQLPAHFSLFLSLLAEELKTRFLKPTKYTLLALKMNPSVDTSDDGELFHDKAGLKDIMTSHYNNR